MEDEYNDECSEQDYNFIMYKICPKNKELDFCYIGHTVNFNERQRHHIRNTFRSFGHKIDVKVNKVKKE